MRHTVSLRTNDPAHEAVTLLLTARVLTDLEADPQLLRFDPSRSTSASLLIKNYTDRPVQLSDLHATTPYVDLSLSALTIPSHGQVTLTGVLRPDAPSGVLSAWLHLRTDLKTVPRMQIRLWAHIP